MSDTRRDRLDGSRSRFKSKSLHQDLDDSNSRGRPDSGSYPTQNNPERRSRKRSPPRNRNESTSPPPRPARPATNPKDAKQPKIDLSLVDPNDPDAIAAIMGFGNFDSTKGKEVEGNVTGAADIRKKQKYKQYLHVKKLYEIPLTRQQLEEKAKQQQPPQ